MTGRPAGPTVLVTGAGGFIGRAPCADLVARGFDVIAASRHPAVADGVRHVPIGRLDGNTDWRAGLDGAELVVHLAAQVHALDDRPGDAAALYHQANCLATLALARQAADAGVRRLMFASSVKVNGEGRERPYTEADAAAPGDDYGRSKAAAEAGLGEIAAATGLETVVLRLPLVYGPGVRANFLRLLRAVDSGWPLPFGAVANRRSLLFLGNLIDAIATALQHPAASGRTFLVSDGSDLSTPELLAEMARVLGRHAWLIPVPVPVLEATAKLARRQREMGRLVGSLAVDSTAFRHALDWSPPFTVAQGLAATARWYRQRGDQAGSPASSSP